MSQEHIANHQINQVTGFIENPAYAYAFDSDKKLMFLERYKANGLSLYDTCAELGLNHSTVLKHYREDQAFKAAYDQAEREYADQLQGVSRRNALNPKMVIERIFHLKALFPEKYGDTKSQQSHVVVKLEASPELLEGLKGRQGKLEKIVEAEVVESARLDVNTENSDGK